jgi:prepilin-type processing-associated H-X9-DG protein
MIPGYRDKSGGANVAFADGHALFKRWKDPGRRWSRGWETPVRNALDREDLAWVLSCLPVQESRRLARRNPDLSVFPPRELRFSTAATGGQLPHGPATALQNAGTFEHY